MNAVKHGLLATCPLTLDEDRKVYREIYEAVIEDYQPAGAMEAILVGRITEITWRLHRVTLAEAGLYEYARFDRTAQLARLYCA